ncbi:MAG: translocation/assembly module TamB domain-containing protein [Paracoccaceae bacterium]
MRRLLPLVLILCLAVPAAAQFSFLGIKNSLVDFALDQISVPGELEITAEGVEDSEEGATEIVGLAVADGEGVWLRVERLSVRWNASRILRGQLEINRLAANGVEVLRAPASEAVAVEVKEDSALAQTDDDPFDWPRSPITTRIELLELLRVSIAPGVIADQSVDFDATGSLRDEGDEQALKLEVTRTDAVAGRILVDFLRDFATNELNLTLEADEAQGGLVAALAGIPNESASRVRLKAEGPLTDWSLTLDAGVDEVLAAEGSAKVAAIGPLAVNADFTVIPGPALAETYGPAVAAALSPSARIRFDIAEDDNGLVTIREGGMVAADLTLDARGTYDRRAAVADLAVEFEARSGLAELADGVEFESFGFTGALEGPLDDLLADGRIALAGLKTAAVDIAAADLAAKVTVKGDVIALDVGGGAEGLRLDRLGPDLLGEAEIRVDGVYDGSTARLATFRIAAAPLTLEASGEADLVEETANFSYKLSAPELGPLAAAYDQDAKGSIAAEGAVTGPFALPRLAGFMALEGLRYQGESYGAVRLEHDATSGETPEGAVKLSADGSRFGPVTFDGDFRMADQALALSDLVATGLGARIAGALEIDLADMLIDGAVDIDAPDLSSLSEALGQPASGAVKGRVALASADAKQSVDLDLDLDGIDAADIRIASAKLEARVTDALGKPAANGALTATGVQTPGASVARLALKGEGSALTSPTPAFDVTADFEGAVAGPASVGSGALTAKGDLSAFDAAVRATNIAADETLGDAEVAALSLTARITDALGDPAAVGEVEASGVSGFGMALAGLKASGSASALLSAPVFDVAAELDGAEIGAARIAGTTITAKGDLEDLTATLRARSIDAGGVSVATAALDARVIEALGGDPDIDANLKLGAANLGAASLSGAALTAKGRLSALSLALNADGALENGDPIKLAMAAKANLAGAGPEATISRLSFAAGETEIALRTPLRVTSADGATRISGLDLSLPGGGLTGSATLHGGGISGDLALDAPDLRPVADLAGLPLDQGALRLTAKFDTRAGSAGADVAVDATGLRFSEGVTDIGALDIVADLDWNGRKADVTASISGPFGDPVRLRASAPLRPTGGLLPEAPPSGQLSGSVDWNGEIGELWALVPAPGHVLGGVARIALQLSGTVAKPEFGGEVGLTDGRYENLDTGTILVNITARSQMELGGGMTINLDADDGSGAPVAARIELKDGDVDARVQATSATLVRRDDVTAVLSVDIAAVGPLTGPDVRGTINIDRAEVRLVAATPPGVADLGPVRIKGQPIEPEPAAAGGDITLHVDVTGPQDIYVRGRGLDSEWKVDLEIRGTAATPIIKGAVEKRRGVLSFLGRSFDLDRGAVRFTGAPGIDPTLDVQLYHENEGVRGGVTVAGTAKAPDISFTSRPSLPEEEVLPRVLFGRSKQSLSAGEALSLALGLATLMDGTGGAIGGVRGAVGLDVLRIDDTEEGAAVTLGSNVTDDVFVGAKQPIGGGSGSVVVEIEIYEDFNIESEVGPDVGTSFGLKWKKDF